MGAGYFVIAILGCGDGSAACTPVATVPTHYATEEQCFAQTANALSSNNDFDFPTLVARCRAVTTPASALKDSAPPATLAWRG